LLSHRSTQNINPKTSLSIVVCVKNGEKHVNNIQYLKNQKLLSNELIIVDDFSSDNTLALLEKFRSADTQIVTPDEDLKGKKSALKKGILSATKDIVLLTDIDCTPASDQWASKILQSYKEDQDIILGYGPYLKFPGLLNKLLRYETVLTAIQYLSYALYHIPYMGVGRNLSYKKSVFLNSDQFSSHMHIPSGDDDLFIASVGKQHKVGVCLDPDSFTYSEPEKTWRSFYKQKSRHISTSSAYSLLHKLLLSVGSSSHILIFVLLLILVTLGSVQLAFYIFFFRLFLLTFILAPAISKLKEKDLIYYLPLLDVILFLYYVILIPALIFKRKEW
jgi:glycosyltransferase involved in cell wall biosynthesis